MIKFVDLGNGFFVKENLIEALDYLESEILDHVFLKVYCNNDNVYEFRGERAKYAWTKIQEIMLPM